MKTRDRQPTIDHVNGQYGAPMGRRDWLPCNAEPRTVRVFHVTLDSGGYDIGGAYWGTGPASERLYCATDGVDYREFTRAKSRKAAIEALNIDPALLCRKP